MSNDFEIYESNKIGLNSKESFVVVRGKTSFLRILGNEPQWELMTATADEDGGHIKVCKEQLRLIEAALRLGSVLETAPKVEKDCKNREFVKICVIKSERDESDEEFNKEISQVLSRFFEFYDEYQSIESRVESEVLDLYSALAVDESGSDVYLSDGMWLSSDGSFHDRGR
jgi:hypothetical protein